MRRLLLLPLVTAALLAGCPPDTSLPVSEECASNTAPYIDNLEIYSWSPPVAEGEEAFGMAMCIHVDWFDPGPDESGNVGSDAPNMFGGLLSVEISGYDAGSDWLDDLPAPVGVTPGAPSGELEYVRCLEESQPDELVHFAIRVRDRCGLSSNEKTASYYLGGGPGEAHLVENPEAGEDGCLGWEANYSCGSPDE